MSESLLMIACNSSEYPICLGVSPGSIIFCLVLGSASFSASAIFSSSYTYSPSSLPWFRPRFHELQIRLRSCEDWGVQLQMHAHYEYICFAILQTFPFPFLMPRTPRVSSPYHQPIAIWTLKVAHLPLFHSQYLVKATEHFARERVCYQSIRLPKPSTRLVR
jgi:hypothetical protein